MKLFNDLTGGSMYVYHPSANGNSFTWSDLGIGFLPSRGFDYGDEYWEHYRSLTDTDIGHKLTDFRASFVSQGGGLPESHCDIGVGSGQFVATFGCKGFDVNPHAKAWLEEQERFSDPYHVEFKSLSFWDVLEHIEDPTYLLTHSDNIFVSLPIFDNVEACLASKHFKPNEHLWYFTEGGFTYFMLTFGLNLVSKSDEETKIGREGIMAYHFSR